MGILGALIGLVGAVSAGDAMDDAESKLASARADFAKASSEVDDAAAELAAAETAYAESPSSSAEKAIDAKERALKLAKLRLEKPRKALEGADARHAEAKAALEVEQRDEERRRVEARRAELREIAAVAAFSAEAQPHAKALLDALELAKKSARAIEQAREKANAAADELRALGDDAHDLDTAHVAGALLLERAKRGVKLWSSTEDQLRYVRMYLGTRSLSAEFEAMFDAGVFHVGHRAPTVWGHEVHDGLKRELAAAFSEARGRDAANSVRHVQKTVTGPACERVNAKHLADDFDAIAVESRRSVIHRVQPSHGDHRATDREAAYDVETSSGDEDGSLASAQEPETVFSGNAA